MAHKCAISKVSRQSGHRVSHANNKRKHVFKANIQTRRVFISDEKRFIKIKVSTRIIRTIDRLGLKETLKKYNMTVKDLM